MKKSTIWLLASVMIIAFVGLLFLQVKYIQITLDTRNEQFDESVKRSLYQVAQSLEIDQTLQFIEEDIAESEEKYSQYNQPHQKYLLQNLLLRWIYQYQNFPIHQLPNY